MNKLFICLSLCFAGALYAAPAADFSIEQRLYELGMAYLSKTNFESAADNFGCLSDMQPYNREALYYYAMSLCFGGEIKQALRCFEALLRACPRNRFYKQMVKSISDSIKKAQFIACLPKKSKGIPAKQKLQKQVTKQSAVHTVSSLIDSERYDEAENLVNKAFCGPIADKYLGYIAYYRRDYKKSLGCLERAIKGKLKDFELYFAAGCVCEKLKKTEKAIEYLLKALSIKDDIFARLELAKVYCQCFKWAEAERLYKEILSKDSAVADAQLGLINIRLEQGYASETINLANSFLIKEPKNADAMFIMAKAYMAMLNYNRAEELSERACNISNAIEHRCLMILADIRRFNINPAIEELEEILQFEPTCALAAVVLSEALITLGENEKAKKVLARLETFCKAPETSYLLALSEVSCGHYAEAEGYYKEFLARSNNSPQAMLEYAKFKELRADSAEAAAIYKRVADNFGQTFFAKTAKEAIARLKTAERSAEFGGVGRKK